MQGHVQSQSQGFKVEPYVYFFFVFPPIVSSYVPGDETKYTVLSQLNYSARTLFLLYYFFMCMLFLCY